MKEISVEDPNTIIDDIENLSQNTTFDKEILNKLQRTLHLKKITSTTIPMYQKDFSSDLTSKKSKNFFPFVKVETNDHSFFIRKSTAIWLFQENERVSSDRSLIPSKVQATIYIRIPSAKSKS